MVTKGIDRYNAMMERRNLMGETKKYAYLGSPDPKNIPFYKRHGFELLGTIQVNMSPSIFPMLRKPRYVMILLILLKKFDTHSN
jgi:hypothetical protein